MSRMLGFCFFLGDALTTIAAFLNSSGIVVVAVFSLLTSIIVAGAWSLLRSLLWPTDFWDELEPDRVVAAQKRSL